LKFERATAEALGKRGRRVIPKLIKSIVKMFLMPGARYARAIITLFILPPPSRAVARLSIVSNEYLTRPKLLPRAHKAGSPDWKTDRMIKGWTAASFNLHRRESLACTEVFLVAEA